MDVIAASIPLFFALIGLEALVARRRGRSAMRLNDSVTDLSLGILSQLSGVFIVLLTYAAFAWATAHWSIQQLGAPAWPDGNPFPARTGLPGFGVSWPDLASWTAVFLLVDLAYYWSHRCSHRVNILWAGHVVHHSSEEYNLSVALRQSAVHGLFTWVFYAPLAVLGVPWVMFAVSHGLNLIYQFWIHTREVGRLGVLEWFLNTPSHHRVHHGVNAKYQDRNYAGVLIIWDRMFGTFTPEEEEPVYGISVPLASWNPLWANVHVFAELFRNALRTRRWRDKLKVVFGHPSWRPPDIGQSIRPPAVTRETFVKFDPVVPRPVRRYVTVQFIAHLLAALLLLRAAEHLPLLHIAAGGFYLALGLANLGGLMEGRPWVRSLETARLVMLVAVCVLLLFLPRFAVTLVIPAGLFGVVSLLWFGRLRPLVPSASPA